MNVASPLASVVRTALTFFMLSSSSKTASEAIRLPLGSTLMTLTLPFQPELLKSTSPLATYWVESALSDPV